MYELFTAYTSFGFHNCYTNELIVGITFPELKYFGNQNWTTLRATGNAIIYCKSAFFNERSLELSTPAITCRAKSFVPAITFKNISVMNAAIFKIFNDY